MKASLAHVRTLGLVVVLLACDDEKKSVRVAALPVSAAVSAMSASPAALPGVAASASADESTKTAPAPRICDNGPEVKTDDPVMEGQLRLKLGKKPGTGVKIHELAAIKSLELSQSKQLSSLDICILPKMTGLKHLFLGPGAYDDLSPIAGLTRLETLRASISKVENLKPLEKLVLLDRLDLGRTPVRDLSAVGKLVNLTELQLDDTQVSDLAPLAACKKLQKLFLKNTLVADLSPLRGLTDLKLLDISGTQIVDTSALASLTGKGLRIKR
jgi:internalin A